MAYARLGNNSMTYIQLNMGNRQSRTSDQTASQDQRDAKARESIITEQQQPVGKDNDDSIPPSVPSQVGTTASGKPYVYPIKPSNRKPLYEPLTEHQFRVIQFYKVHITGTLKYRMLTFDVRDKPPPYYTLSYSWGSPSFTNGLICNKHYIYVSDNLYSALQQFKVLGPFYLWADQICINQEDKLERAKQILLMGKIYSRAIQTLVWLGPMGDLATPELLEYLEVMKVAMHDAEKATDENGVTAPDSVFAYVSIPPELIGLPPDGSPAWDALYDVLCRPWFRRTWVLQEIVLSQTDPSLICGNISMDLNPLYHSIKWFCSSIQRGRHNFGFSAMKLSADITLEMLDIANSTDFLSKKTKNKNIRWRFSHLMYTLMNLEATDDRDLIYGVLGLTEFAADGSTYPDCLVPDYSIDPYLLYRQVALYAIGESRDLRILRDAGLWPRPDDTRGPCKLKVPSWTPQFNKKNKRFGATSIMTRGASRIAADGVIETELKLRYHASAWMPVESRASEDPDVLTLKGLQVDRVKLALPAPVVDGVDLPAFSTSKTLDFWEAAMKHENLDEYSSDEALHKFAVRFFSFFFILDRSDGEYQGLKNLSDQDLRNSWHFLCLAYEANPHRPNASLAWVRYDVFAHGGRSSDIHFTSLNMAPFITDRGHFGFGPAGAREGDCIFVLFGGHHPSLLEKCGEEYHYLGEASVREYMDGQAIDAWKKGEIEEQWLRIH